MIEAKTLKALSFWSNTQEEGWGVGSEYLDHAKGQVGVRWYSGAEKAIRVKNPSYLLGKRKQLNLALDLGEFTSAERLYLFPMQARYPKWIYQKIMSFKFPLMGKSGINCFPGEFANIAKIIPFPGSSGFWFGRSSFIRLKAIKTTDGNSATFAETRYSWHA